MDWLPPMGDISNIINGNLSDWIANTTLFNIEDLANAIVFILQVFIRFFAYIWNILFATLLQFDFSILGFTFDFSVSLVTLIGIGGFLVLVLLKLIALIPIVPD